MSIAKLFFNGITESDDGDSADCDGWGTSLYIAASTNISAGSITYFTIIVQESDDESDWTELTTMSMGTSSTALVVKATRSKRYVRCLLRFDTTGSPSIIVAVIAGDDQSNPTGAKALLGPQFVSVTGTGAVFDCEGLPQTMFFLQYVGISLSTFTSKIQESDDQSSWSDMTGGGFAPADDGYLEVIEATRTKRYIKVSYTVATVPGPELTSVAIIAAATATPLAGDVVYFGRAQQGDELILSLQCHDANLLPEDPQSPPYVQIYLDGEPPELLESLPMPSDMRRVEDGLFRLNLPLDTLYSTEGRYLVVLKWLDSDGVSHTETGSFHLLPGGSADGSVIGMCSLIRQAGAYLILQCDSGRLIRKLNPR